MFTELLPSLPTSSHVPAAARVPGRALLTLLASLALLNPLSIDMYLPSFPKIQEAFGSTYAQLELSMSAFFVGMIGGQLGFGPLSDRFGRKWPLLVGMALFAVASVGCALSRGVYFFVACRLVQALGGCAGMVTSRAIVRDVFDGRRAAQVFSMLMLFTGLGPMFGPSLGIALAQRMGWQAIFWLLAAYGLCVALLATWLLPEEVSRPRGALSWRGAWQGYRQTANDPTFIAYTLAGAAASGGMFAYITGAPFVFIGMFGVHPQHFGYLFAANACGMVAMSQLNRVFLARLPMGVICRRAAGITAVAGMTLLAITAGGATALAVTIAPLFVFLASLGLIFPNTSALALGHQPAERAATAAALNGVVQWLVALVASLAISRLHDGSARPLAAVVASAGLVAYGVLAALALRPRVACNGASPGA